MIGFWFYYVQLATFCSLVEQSSCAEWSLGFFSASKDFSDIKQTNCWSNYGARFEAAQKSASQPSCTSSFELFWFCNYFCFETASVVEAAITCTYKEETAKCECSSTMKRAVRQTSPLSIACEFENECLATSDVYKRRACAITILTTTTRLPLASMGNKAPKTINPDFFYNNDDDDVTTNAGGPVERTGAPLPPHIPMLL